MPKESNFTIRLSKAAREFNVSVMTIRKFLAMKGFQVDSSPNTKLTVEMHELLMKEFHGEKDAKNEAKKLGNISYKGGSASIESDSYTSAVANPTKEEIMEIEKRRKQKEKELKPIKEERFAKAKQKEKRNEKKEKTIETKVEYNAAFSELIFEQGYISLIYNKKYCIYRDYRIRGYNKIIEQIYSKSNKGQDAIKASSIRVVIDLETETFVFKNIDICRYVNRLKEIYLPENKSVIQGNRIQEKKEKESVTEPTNEENNNEEEILVSLSKLHFGNNIISLKHNKIDFVLWEKGVSMYLNSEQSINNLSTKILLNYSDLSLQFLDLSLLSELKDLSGKLEKEKLQEKLQRQKEKEAKEEKRLRKQKEKEEKEKAAKEERQLRKQKEKERLREQKKKAEKITLPKIEPQPLSPALKTMALGAGNIHFFNGYYLIFQTNNGEVDNTVNPYRVDDPNSHEILNLVHKYFEKIFEQKRIIVKIDETRIIEPSRLDLFQLSNYVRELKRNLDEKKGVWWAEVQNARKRSFVQCIGEPTESVKKRVAKSKNEYLYNLSSLQNEKKLIRVYEINHGKEEDAFIFTINMSNNKCAIVFENASNDASTTTWIFVAKDEDYESCINLVFDYFTNYTVFKKRSSLRDTINPPEKFKAASYAFIYHDDIGQWLKKLNKILGQTPEPSEIQFVPGLHIPESSDTRTGHGDTITTTHLHNQLMRKLYDKLCGESGKDNVGTEIRVGEKRIDTVVKGKEFFDIYEIKTATNPFDCVTEALGQLCQYAYLYCPDKIGKLVIVGPSETTKEVEQYLSTLRKNHSLQLYYMKV